MKRLFLLALLVVSCVCVAILISSRVSEDKPKFHARFLTNLETEVAHIHKRYISAYESRQNPVLALLHADEAINSWTCLRNLLTDEELKHLTGLNAHELANRLRTQQQELVGHVMSKAFPAPENNNNNNNSNNPNFAGPWIQLTSYYENMMKQEKDHMTWQHQQQLEEEKTQFHLQHQLAQERLRQEEELKSIRLAQSQFPSQPEPQPSLPLSTEPVLIPKMRKETKKEEESEQENEESEEEEEDEETEEEEEEEDEDTDKRVSRPDRGENEDDAPEDNGHHLRKRSRGTPENKLTTLEPFSSSTLPLATPEFSMNFLSPSTPTPTTPSISTSTAVPQQQQQQPFVPFVFEPSFQNQF